jgi:glycosyltransferase involved in cell wall biosynthesis
MSRVGPLITIHRSPDSAPPSRRVLFATNMWPDERRPYYGTFIKSQADSLVAAGVPLDVLVVRGYESVRAYVRAMASLREITRANAYGLVHVHYGHTAAASIPSRPEPLVISYCGEDLLGAPRGRGITPKSRIEVACFRQVARLADATITKSREMADVLPASVRDRNRIIPNGVDLNVFAPRDRRRAREALGWSGDEKVLLFLGDPGDPRKNVGLAREAAGLVAGRVPGVRLVEAFGTPPARVPTLMNAADCLLMTSTSEGSPNVVKEAMASALPVVATVVGDVAERFEGVEGCYAVGGDPNGVAEAIELALELDRAPDARRAVEPLSVEAIAADLLSLYSELGYTPA